MRTMLPIAALFLASLPSFLLGQEPTWGKLTLSGWKKQLQDPSEDVRHAAAMEFMFMDLAMMKQAIPELKEALKDQNDHVRSLASQSLYRCNKDTATSVPMLIAMLGRKDSVATDTQAREQAVESLGNLGETSAVPALIRQFGVNPRLDDATAFALCRLGTAAKPALPALKQLIRKDAPPEVLAHAGMAIAGLEPEAPEVKQAVTLLTPVERFSKFAPPPFLKTEFLVRFPELTIRHVVPLLEDKDPLVRRGAARVLMAAGSRAKQQATVPLQKALQDSEADVRIEVVKGLNVVAPDEFSPAVPVLVNLLGAHRCYPHEAAEMLRIRQDDALPLLIRELEKKTTYDHSSVVETLHFLRQMDHYSMPPLDAETLAKRDAQIISALAHPCLMIRRGAAAVITRLGPHATTAVPSLLQLTKDADAEARLDAIAALVAVDPAHHSWPKWLPSLEEVVCQRDPAVQLRAIVQIRTLGPAAKSAVPTLLKAVEENSGHVRTLAAITVVYADPTQKDKVLPALLEEIKNEDNSWFVDTAEALGEFGPAGKAAGPALKAALAAKKHYPYHQAKLIKALSRVDHSQMPLCRQAVEELSRDEHVFAVPRIDALMLLPEWGVDARPLAPVLRELATKTKPGNSRLGVAAAVTLVLIGSDEDGTGRKMIRMVISSSEEGQRREHLLRIADRLGPLARPLAFELHPLTTDAHFGEYAKVVLAKIDPKLD